MTRQERRPRASATSAATSARGPMRMPQPSRFGDSTGESGRVRREPRMPFSFVAWASDLGGRAMRLHGRPAARGRGPSETRSSRRDRAAPRGSQLLFVRRCDVVRVGQGKLRRPLDVNLRYALLCRGLGDHGDQRVDSSTHEGEPRAPPPTTRSNKEAPTRTMPRRPRLSPRSVAASSRPRARPVTSFDRILARRTTAASAAPIQ
jgi:hypothetical protein